MMDYDGLWWWGGVVRRRGGQGCWRRSTGWWSTGRRRKKTMMLTVPTVITGSYREVLVWTYCTFYIILPLSIFGPAEWGVHFRRGVVVSNPQVCRWFGMVWLLHWHPPEPPCIHFDFSFNGPICIPFCFEGNPQTWTRRHQSLKIRRIPQELKTRISNPDRITRASCHLN